MSVEDESDNWEPATAIASESYVKHVAQSQAADDDDAKFDDSLPTVMAPEGYEAKVEAHVSGAFVPMLADGTKPPRTTNPTSKEAAITAATMGAPAPRPTPRPIPVASASMPVIQIPPAAGTGSTPALHATPPAAEPAPTQAPVIEPAPPRPRKVTAQMPAPKPLQPKSETPSSEVPPLPPPPMVAASAAPVVAPQLIEASDLAPPAEALPAVRSRAGLWIACVIVVLVSVTAGYLFVHYMQ